MSDVYRNPWHKPGLGMYGTEFYSTDAKPVEYRGFLIFERIKGTSFEVVKDGVCLSQRAGLSGAKYAIDLLLDEPEDFFAQRMAGYLQEFAGASA